MRRKRLIDEYNDPTPEVEPESATPPITEVEETSTSPFDTEPMRYSPFEDPPVLMYTVADWNGHPLYLCTRCPIDLLDGSPDAMLYHWAVRHNPNLIDPNNSQDRYTAPDGGN